MRKVGKILKFIFDTTHKGFYFICLVFSRGFYFYFYKVAVLLKKKFKDSTKIDSLIEYYKELQEKPVQFFLLVFSCVLLFSVFSVVFSNNGEMINLDRGQQEVGIYANLDSTNFYKKYGNMQLGQIDFNSLKTVNKNVKAWLSVDGTYINYPIVQTTDNNYYLTHNFDNSKANSGWPFMDYRNKSDLSDDNTIFYGHNLVNKTSFGSISNLVTKKWFNNSSRLIILATDSKFYAYEIFSVYYVEGDSNYLETNFSTDSEYKKFLKNLKDKSEVDFSVTVNEDDKIITLSTCAGNDKEKIIVHAVLISALVE